MKTSRLGRLTAVTALAVFALLTVAASGASGGTWVCMVINDRLNTTYRWHYKHDLAPLQTAINAASPGDTLWVRGTCPGPIGITKSLTLTGQAIPGFNAEPGINASDAQASVVHVSGSGVDVRLTSLILTRGGNYRMPAEHGGGIWNEQATLTLDNVTITQNFAKNGGGIYNDHGTVVVNDSTIDSNSAGGRFSRGDGGGIATEYGSLTVNRSTITHNAWAYNGGGIYAWASTVAVNGSEIAHNQTDTPMVVPAYKGGGIWIDADSEDGGATLTVTDTKIHDSDATTSGGGIYANRVNVTITGASELSGNHATGGGGAWVSGALLLGGETRIHGNIAVDTYETFGQGGGVAFFPVGAAGSRKLTMSGNAQIYGNTAHSRGGGLMAYRSTDLVGCVAGSQGDEGVNVFNNALFDNTVNNISTTS